MTPSRRLFSVSVIFLFILSGAQAQMAYSLKAFKVTIDGTSSLHDWTSDVTKVEWSGHLLVEGNSLKDIKDVTVTMPVESIKSTKGGTMDNKTYEAFVYDKNPNITYKLSTIKITGDKVHATGALTMAGHSKTIAMDLTAALTNGDVQLTGAHKLNMKEFKMKPPKAVMGTIKVGEEVTVKFDLTLTPAK